MLAFVKIGVVFALATSWPAYRTLVYDVALTGPAELAADIGLPARAAGRRAAGSSGGSTMPTRRLARSSAILGAGEAPSRAHPRQAGDRRAVAAAAASAGFDAFALGGARMLFLLGAVGGARGVRMIAGLMLALGPVLHRLPAVRRDARPVRRLGAGAWPAPRSARSASSIALGLELALPRAVARRLLARRMAGEAMPDAAAELFVIA